MIQKLVGAPGSMGTSPQMDASAVARLPEQTARAIYESRGPRATHAGQWAVLRYLARASKQGRTVGSVATYLCVTDAPASRAVASLARKSYEAVKADTEDRRVRRIELTLAGMALLAHDPVHRLTTAIEGMTDSKQKDLAATLDVLHARLVKVG